MMNPPSLGDVIWVLLCLGGLIYLAIQFFSSK